MSLVVLIFLRWIFCAKIVKSFVMFLPMLVVMISSLNCYCYTIKKFCNVGFWSKIFTILGNLVYNDEVFSFWFWGWGLGVKGCQVFV